MHAQEEIKKTLPPGQTSAPQVSKKASEMWKSLSAEERLHWDNEAAKEKARYIAEKEIYTGPWQVPQRRAKKDPSAPKRNPSAFLLFSLTKRKELKSKNPALKNTDISRMLGELWRVTSDEEKQPFIDQEAVEREKYKEEMSVWRELKAKDDEIKKQERAERTEQILFAKAEAETRALAEKQDDVSSSQMTHTTQSSHRNDEIMQKSQYSRYSPVIHPGRYVDSNPYVQQRGSWSNLDPQLHQQHQAHASYKPYHSYLHQMMGNNSFDIFQNQQDLMFPDHNLYDPGQQRSIKLEERTDSPYPYIADEFDPVPIHG